MVAWCRGAVGCVAGAELSNGTRSGGPLPPCQGSGEVPESPPPCLLGLSCTARLLQMGGFLTSFSFSFLCPRQCSKCLLRACWGFYSAGAAHGAARGCCSGNVAVCQASSWMPCGLTHRSRRGGWATPLFRGMRLCSVRLRSFFKFQGCLPRSV